MNFSECCGNCGLVLRPKQNGVTVIDMTVYGPVAIVMADEWACPECDTSVIKDYGKPYAIRSQISTDEWDDALKKAQSNPALYRENWLNKTEQDQYYGRD